MNNYPPEVLGVLIKGGWFEKRAVDTDLIKSFVIGEGFAWFPQVEEFLKEFAGLYFTCRASDGSFTDFRFDVFLSIESFDTFWIQKYYQNIIADEDDFCPVGVLNGSCMQLFLGNEGGFYAGYDDMLIFLGKNTEVFLFNLCSRGGENVLT